MQPALGTKESCTDCIQRRLGRVGQSFMPSPLGLVNSIVSSNRMIASAGEEAMLVVFMRSVSADESIPVLSSFSFNDVLMSLFDGIKNFCQSRTDITAMGLFSILTYRERSDPSLTTNKILFLRSDAARLLETSIATAEPPNQSRRHSSVSSGSDRGTTTPKVTASSASGKHRGSGTSSAPQFQLTADKLKELQRAMDPLAQFLQNKRNGAAIPSLSQICSDRETEPERVILRSIQSSRQLRNTRAAKVMSILQELPSLM
jgi:hypothetical protein